MQCAIEKVIKREQKSSSTGEGYLYRVIRNAYIDQFRQRQRFDAEPFDENQHSIDYDIASLESISIDSQSVDQLMKQLSSGERELLFLWAVEEYTTQEVADLLDIPKGTVLSRIFRLRNKILKTEKDNESIKRGVAL